MRLDEVLARLYESEINCSISSFWDCGLTVALGDHMNGFVARDTVQTPEEAAAFLDRMAREKYPVSLYALGREPTELELAQSPPVSVLPDLTCWQECPLCGFRNEFPEMDTVIALFCKECGQATKLDSKVQRIQ